MFNPEIELEEVRCDLCQFCPMASRTTRYSAAYRKHKKNGKLIRWEHVFDGDKDNAIACLAGASREREYEGKKGEKR